VGLISAVRLEALAIERGGRVLFRDLTMTLGAGEAVAVIGANGSGKTSLLRAVAGLLRPLAGEVVFEGGGSAADARRASCHLLGHQDGVKGARTALEELLFQCRWCGASEAAAAAAAERLGLSRQLGLETRRLSAGQKRRLALARLVAAPRSLWLLDEPLAPVDLAGRALVGEIMAAHILGGGLILAAVHDPLPIPARTLALGA
jgi:heme exporter protein A